MRIAMLYIAEAYQCYHGHAVALALAEQPGVDVTVYYNDHTTPHHLARIEHGYAAAPLPAIRLKTGLLGGFIQKLRLLGMAKKQVMNANLDELLGYDAIIATEVTVAHLRHTVKGRIPPLILAIHGAGDRSVTWDPLNKDFDLLLPSGAKTLRRFEELNLVRPGGAALAGYVKLDTTAKMARNAEKLFPNERTTVLYNAHKEPRQTSWKSAIEPLLMQFSEQQDFNLIVAPHVKMFRRRSQKLRNQWEARSTKGIIIDTGSDRSVDNSYCEGAGIYLGDVSSQVYEFTAQPRPCVFLNMHRVDWRDNPEYLFWQMGEVIECVTEILPAIRRAHALHPQYIDRQRELTEAALGDVEPGSPNRAARHILQFLATGSAANG
jgi:hypothetical protein